MYHELADAPLVFTRIHRFLRDVNGKWKVAPGVEGGARNARLVPVLRLAVHESPVVWLNWSLGLEAFAAQSMAAY